MCKLFFTSNNSNTRFERNSNNIAFNIIIILTRYIKRLKTQFLVYFITINYNRIKCNSVFNIKHGTLTQVSYRIIKEPCRDRNCPHIEKDKRFLIYWLNRVFIIPVRIILYYV